MLATCCIPSPLRSACVNLIFTCLNLNFYINMDTFIRKCKFNFYLFIFYHYLLYIIVVGIFAGSRPPYAINGSIYPREWWDFP